MQGPWVPRSPVACRPTPLPRTIEAEGGKRSPEIPAAGEWLGAALRLGGWGHSFNLLEALMQLRGWQLDSCGVHCFISQLPPWSQEATLVIEIKNKLLFLLNWVVKFSIHEIHFFSSSPPFCKSWIPDQVEEHHLFFFFKKVWLIMLILHRITFKQGGRLDGLVRSFPALLSHDSEYGHCRCTLPRFDYPYNNLHF